MATGRDTPAGRDTLTALEDALAEPGWTFPVGEEATYRVDVALGPVGTPRPVGEARLRVEARDTVGGRPAYRTSLELEARIPLIYRMDNRQVSWIAPDPFRTLMYEERLREGDHRRHRRYRLDQEEGTYTRFDRGDGGWRAVEGWTGVSMPPRALDEVAFLYLVRALSLEPGRTYRLTRHFEEDGNPVILEVLRRETVRVPAGRFETVVVRPVIRTSGLFSRGGRAEVFVTDDRRRLIVEIRSRMKMGRVHFRLESYSPGATPPPAATGRTTGPGAGAESPGVRGTPDHGAPPRRRGVGVAGPPGDAPRLRNDVGPGAYRVLQSPSRGRRFAADAVAGPRRTIRRHASEPSGGPTARQGPGTED
jgi:hypothetical protein